MFQHRPLNQLNSSYYCPEDEMQILDSLRVIPDSFIKVGCVFVRNFCLWSKEVCGYMRIDRRMQPTHQMVK